MTPDFTTLHYLKTGTPRQQQAYQELHNLQIFEQLAAYKPILAGTIPIDIDLPSSDLDIICECQSHTEFANDLTRLFGHQQDFTIKTRYFYGIQSTVANFQGKQFPIEIFGQNLPCEQQYAYQHMLIEYRILQEQGAAFKAKIRQLKRQGVKTEPAFAKLLGLEGDAYVALLKWEKWNSF